MKVKALAFSQDGKMLAVGSFEGIVKLLEIDEDDRLNEFGQSCR